LNFKIVTLKSTCQILNLYFPTLVFSKIKT